MPRNRLLTTSSMVTTMLMLLLAIHPYLALAGTTTHTVTAHGNAQIDTAQSKFGGASGLFDGSGDYLSTPDSDDWNFGTGDFTIDFWVRFNSLPANGEWATFYCQRPSGWQNQVYFGFRNIGGAYSWDFSVYSGGAAIMEVIKATTVSTNTWYHIAVVRSGNNFYIFQDGAQVGTAVTDSDSVPDLASTLTIGRLGVYDGYYFNGWLDEFRVSKGSARWTSNFTPPSAAYTADSPTVLLLHMNGADGSTTFTDDCVFAGPDFSISASPTSQSVGAGATATYTLSLSSSGGYSGTISLSVTSGLPSGAAATITPDSVNTFPATATLSISTSITTPGGTSSIVVTAADGTITRTVTVSLTVSAPASSSFNVRAGATQIVVTLTYSWSGTGSPPQASITITGPGGTPTLQESAGVVYDRTSITVSGSTSTYSIIHRVTFTITAPGSAQTWTALVSLSGVSNYSIAIEVS